MFFKFLFGSSDKQTAILKSFDIKTLLHIKRNIVKCSDILQSVTANAKVYKAAGILAKDGQGKAIDITDIDQIGLTILLLETTEYLIETRIILLAVKTNNPLSLDDDLFDLKFMIIRLMHLFEKGAAEREVVMEKARITDVEFVQSDAKKIRYILMTLLQIVIQYAKPEESITTTAFRHDEFFCFYVTTSLDRQEVSHKTPLSNEAIKKEIRAQFQDGIQLTEKYIELIGGRLGLVESNAEKNSNEVKFIVELSIFKV